MLNHYLNILTGHLRRIKRKIMDRFDSTADTESDYARAVQEMKEAALIRAFVICS
jgi:hypothetical protein